MSRRRAALAIGLTALLGAGAVGAGALQDQPQDARPADDPIGDLLRESPRTDAPQEPPAASTPPPVAVAAPPAVTVAPVTVAVAPVAAPAEPPAEKQDEKAEAAAPTPPAEPGPPPRRLRRPVAVVQAIDKITTETMQFEVEVGGRPVRFNDSLIFAARACEVSAADDPTEDSVAYLEVSLQPRAQGAETRQIFRGWMFASTPGVSGLQHPVYDAWVVGCKA